MGIKEVTPRTLRKVVKYLEEELGLEVIGPVMRPDGSQFQSMMTYNAEEVVSRRRHIMRDTLQEPEYVD